MFKACITFLLAVTFLFGVTTTNSEAKTKKKKNSAPTSNTSKNNKKNNKKNKKNRKNKSTKSKRSYRSGTGPDLRALTTEKPFDEYIQNPDNGVNAVETKSEIE